MDNHSYEEGYYDSCPSRCTSQEASPPENAALECNHDSSNARVEDGEHSSRDEEYPDTDSETPRIA